MLRAARLSVNANCVPTALQVFYNDEHAVSLGVRQVQVKTSSGTTTTDYQISALSSNPGSAMPPLVGSMIPSGDQAGTDVSGRPLFPALFVTDLTDNPGNPYAGDWQNGGTAIAPSAIFGTWKGAIRKIDKTRSPNVVTVTPDSDPAKNHWNLGPGSDPVPAALVDEGYGAEVRWDITALNLTSGHQYRLYFMVHDGDQNKDGGDAGQACAIFTMPGTAPSPTPGITPTPTPTPASTPTPTPAPTPSPSCPTISVNPGSLPNGTVGQSYSKNIIAGGGSSPYTFMVSSGSLPAGLTLSSGGNLSGTPTAAGDFALTIQATDRNGCSGSKQYTITISCPAIDVKPNDVPDGKVGQSYNKTITADHGSSPYSFTVSSGSLPPGLTLSSGGILSGTPTVAATYTFTVQATDSYRCTGSEPYSLKIKN